MTQMRAMVYALAAFFAGVLVDTSIKLATQTAISPFTIMAIIGTVSAIGIVIASFWQNNPTVLKPISIREQTLVCFCSLAIYYLNVIALKHLPLTVFYIVAFTAPLIVAALSTFLKHESMSPVKIACLLAGFIGVLLSVSWHGADGGEWIGYLAILTSVVAFAVYMVTVRKISQTDTMHSIQFLNAAVVGLVGWIGAWLQTSPLPDSRAFLMLVIAGVINLISGIFYNTALKNTTSTNVAQLHYTQIISGAVIGYLIWHEIPTWNLIVGSIIIIASGLIIATGKQEGDRYNQTDLLPK